MKFQNSGNTEKILKGLRGKKKKGQREREGEERRQRRERERTRKQEGRKEQREGCTVLVSCS